MPRFNVIFDIHIADAVSVPTYANELTRIPRRMKARLQQHSTRIQRLVREPEIREAGPGFSVQQDSSNNSSTPPGNVVGTFQNVNEELSSRFNFPRSRASAAFPANSHPSLQIASGFNPAANYGGRIAQRLTLVHVQTKVSIVTC